MKNYILFILSLLLFGCVTSETETSSEQEITTSSLEFACNFNIEHHEVYTKLSILSPWEENKVLNTYYLVKNDSVTVPTDGVRIKVPVANIAVNSCSHVAYIDALSEIEKLIASTDPYALRFSCSHAISVVPEPANKSSTTSPSFVEFLTCRRINSIGFIVG